LRQSSKGRARNAAGEAWLLELGCRHRPGRRSGQGRGWWRRAHLLAPGDDASPRVDGLHVVALAPHLAHLLWQAGVRQDRNSQSGMPGLRRKSLKTPGLPCRPTQNSTAEHSAAEHSTRSVASHAAPSAAANLYAPRCERVVETLVGVLHSQPSVTLLLPADLGAGDCLGHTRTRASTVTARQRSLASSNQSRCTCRHAGHSHARTRWGIHSATASQRMLHTHCRASRIRAARS
jgi:hypothetical protein